MRQDLIKLLEKENDVTNAVILTHNIDFVFLQLVVLPALKRCGQPTLTIFADAACAAETFSYQSTILSGLGTRYRVVPVFMEPGFRFHPKAVLLSGPERGSLLVGSGNLTFGGWRDNAEIWVRFDSEMDGTGPFSSFIDFLNAVMARVPLSNGIEAEIQEAFDPNTRIWAKNLDPPSGLLGKVDSGEALLSKMIGILDTQVDRLQVCSPYFDLEGHALQEIMSRVSPGSVEVLAQKGKSGLSKLVAERLSGRAKVVPVGFKCLSPKEGDRQRFIHAKFYCFEQGDRVLMFAGSANCSQAALLIPGGAGNAELLAYQTVTKEECRKICSEDLELLEGDPELTAGKAEEEPSLGKYEIKILAARFEAGELRIAFSCSANIKITGGVVDDSPAILKLNGTSIAIAELDLPPKSVVLEGHDGLRSYRSNVMWVDNEKDLSSSARIRGVASAIRSGVRSEAWSFGAWAGILEVVGKHLQYLPDRPISLTGRKPGQEKSKRLDFLESDVFSGKYTVPKLGDLPTSISEDGRIGSLRQMLLRWFGISGQEDEERPETTNKDGPDPDNNDEEDEETVDQPVPIPGGPKQTRKGSVTKLTQTENRRGQQILGQLTEVITGLEYLKKRNPEHLAKDIKIVSILLTSGMREGWLNREDFLVCTHKVWSAFFFSSELNNSVGAIEERYRLAELKENFKESMASASLSAALISWAMLSRPDTRTPEEARFTLATILSVARNPWLWCGDDPAEVGREMSKFWRLTGRGTSELPIRWEEIGREWQKLISRGRSIAKFEKAVKDLSPPLLKGKITQEEIVLGECLWQGTSGFCVATMKCKRSVGQKVTALRLHGKATETKFQADFAIPLRALLSDPALIPPEALDVDDREEILGIADEIISTFG